MSENFSEPSNLQAPSTCNTSLATHQAEGRNILILYSMDLPVSKPKELPNQIPFGISLTTA